MGALNSKHALFQVDHGIQKLIFYFIRCELSMRLALAMSSAFAEIAEFHANLKKLLSSWNLKIFPRKCDGHVSSFGSFLWQIVTLEFNHIAGMRKICLMNPNAFLVSRRMLRACDGIPVACAAAGVPVSEKKTGT